MKKLKLFSVIALLGFLSSCGGGGGTQGTTSVSQAANQKSAIGTNADPVIAAMPTDKMTVQIASTYQPALKTVTGIDTLLLTEVDVDIFDAPVSMGLGLGSIFIHEGIAYKVTAALLIDGLPAKVRLYTESPKINEIYSSLKIKGRFPLHDNPSQISGSIDLKSLTAKGELVAKDAPALTDLSLLKLKNRVASWFSKTSQTLDCSVSATGTDRSDAETGKRLFGFSSQASCSEPSGFSQVSDIAIEGYVDINFDLNRVDSLNATVFVRNDQTMSFNFSKAFEENFRKELYRFSYPIGATGLFLVVPIDLIASAKAQVSGEMSWSNSAEVQAVYKAGLSDNLSDHSATLTSNGSGVKVKASSSAGAQVSVGVSPGIGIALLGARLGTVNVDGKVKAQVAASSARTDGCVAFSASLTADVIWLPIIGGESIIANVADKTIWPTSGSVCAANPEPKIQHQGIVVSSETTVHYTPGVESVLNSSASITHSIPLVSSLWRQVGGDMKLAFGTANAATTSVTSVDSNGSMAIVQLSLVNALNREAEKTIIVRRNLRPVIVGTIAPVSSSAKVRLDATGSFDPDGRISAFVWTLENGQIITSNNPVIEIPVGTSARPIKASLSVFDNLAESKTSVQRVETLAPTAAFTSPASSAIVGQTVLFDSGASIDPDGTIAQRQWAINGVPDTSVSNQIIYSKYFNVVGTYLVQLTVTDDKGATNTTKQSFAVGAIGSKPVQPIAGSGLLNDTGLTVCANYAYPPYAAPNLGDYSAPSFDCISMVDASGIPIPAGQDAVSGRDAQAAAGLLTKTAGGGGRGGFDFTKLDASGNSLPASSPTWACVKDNHTKLIWENKTSDGGLRDYRHTYTWYDDNFSTNGGNSGNLSSNTCGGTLGTLCSTFVYVLQVNAATYCGASNWRLPEVEELRSISDYGTGDRIDKNFFPLTRGDYWSSTTYAFDTSEAWFVLDGLGSIPVGVVDGRGKLNARHVRLVRNAP
jgi:Protein of unknown function (DUF1566)/PKD domain